jgi:hypothetical protein
MTRRSGTCSASRRAGREEARPLRNADLARPAGRQMPARRGRRQPVGTAGGLPRIALEARVVARSGPHGVCPKIRWNFETSQRRRSVREAEEDLPTVVPCHQPVRDRAPRAHNLRRRLDRRVVQRSAVYPQQLASFLRASLVPAAFFGHAFLGQRPTFSLSTLGK